MTEITQRLTTALADRYRIERHIGDGGMAIVFQAEDLKHKRKVAVKVLRPELAAVLGAERFVQEIETTANLQHPHILPLHDSGDADGFLYYVMPFIDGETLRDKLNRETQLGIEEAVKITTEVADALNYAHRNNVIHRDIKPENILLHDGRPMVADFGIALALSAAAGGRMTETGMSLGTPHYMSPEQATAEKDLTNRSDIYSLGCVLYEMLTGDPPHTGSSAQAIIMKIVTDEARPVTELRKSVPPHVAAATAKSLEKLAADRFESAAKFAEALTNPAFTVPTTQAASVAGAPARWSWNRLSLGLAAALVIVTAVAAWSLLQPEPPKPVSRYSVLLPEGQRLAGLWGRVALSPDGSRLVYAGGGEGGQNQLWVRHRDQLEATALAGTEGAVAPFFSPDGDQVGFLAIASGSGLNVASLRGGPPIQVTDSLVGPAGGSWGPDGFIYTDGAGNTPLVRVLAAGGAPEWFTTLDSASGEANHRFPDVLPKGKGVIFTVGYGQTGVLEANIAVADVATGAHQVLLRGAYARYATSGHLLYVTDNGTLMAVPFDENSLTIEGEPTALVDGIALRTFNVPDLAVSHNGTLVYAVGGAAGPGGKLVWVDRDGRSAPVAEGWTDAVTSLALSPDGTQLAVSIAEDETHVWIGQLARGTRSRLTFQGTRNDRPEWTPDGRSVAFMTNRLSNLAIFQRRADGTAAAELLLDVDVPLQEVRLTRDGAWLVHRRGSLNNSDLYALRIGGDSALVPLVTTEFRETAPAVSPDGRWLAYVSNETGRMEVYVHPFPNVDDGRWLVSTGGGTEPVWARSGRELFYRNGRQDLVAVAVLPGEAFAMGEQRTLFSAQPYLANVNHRMYDITPNDQRFVMIRVQAEAGRDDTQLIVVENFFEELKAKVGN